MVATANRGQQQGQVLTLKNTPCCSPNSCSASSGAGKAISYQNRAAHPIFPEERHLLSEMLFDFPAERALSQDSQPHLPQCPPLLGQGGPLLPQPGVSHGWVSPVPISRGYGPSFALPLGAESIQNPTSSWGKCGSHSTAPSSSSSEGRKNLSPGQFKPVGLGGTLPCSGAARQPIIPGPSLTSPAAPGPPSLQLQSRHQTNPNRSFGSV